MARGDDDDFKSKMQEFTKNSFCEQMLKAALDGHNKYQMSGGGNNNGGNNSVGNRDRGNNSTNESNRDNNISPIIPMKLLDAFNTANKQKPDEILVNYNDKSKQN